MLGSVLRRIHARPIQDQSAPQLPKVTVFRFGKQYVHRRQKVGAYTALTAAQILARNRPKGRGMTAGPVSRSEKNLAPERFAERGNQVLDGFGTDIQAAGTVGEASRDGFGIAIEIKSDVKGKREAQRGKLNI